MNYIIKDIEKNYPFVSINPILKDTNLKSKQYEVEISERYRKEIGKSQEVLKGVRVSQILLLNGILEDWKEKFEDSYEQKTLEISQKLKSTSLENTILFVLDTLEEERKHYSIVSDLEGLSVFRDYLARPMDERSEDPLTIEKNKFLLRQFKGITPKIYDKLHIDQIFDVIQYTRVKFEYISNSANAYEDKDMDRVLGDVFYRPNSRYTAGWDLVSKTNSEAHLEIIANTRISKSKNGLELMGEYYDDKSFDWNLDESLEFGLEVSRFVYKNMVDEERYQETKKILKAAEKTPEFKEWKKDYKETIQDKLRKRRKKKERERSKELIESLLENKNPILGREK